MRMLISKFYILTFVVVRPKSDVSGNLTDPIFLHPTLIFLFFCQTLGRNTALEQHGLSDKGHTTHVQYLTSAVTLTHSLET